MFTRTWVLQFPPRSGERGYLVNVATTMMSQVSSCLTFRRVQLDEPRADSVFGRSRIEHCRSTHTLTFIPRTVETDVTSRAIFAFAAVNSTHTNAVKLLRNN